MTKEFVLQDPGEGLHEAEISEVHVSEGDTVEESDALLTVETDKVSVEIPSPFRGTIEDLRVGEGDQVRVGEVLLTYDEAGSDGSAAGREEQNGPEGEAANEEASDQATSDQEAERGEPTEEGQEDKASARGGEGAETETKPSETQKETTETAPAARDRRRPVPASPATRRLARELDVDLHEAEGSGPEGRVTADDVRAAAGEGAERPAPGEREGSAARESGAVRGRADFELPRLETPDLPDFDQYGPVERMPLRGVRRVTAKRMALSASQVAAVTHHDVADITGLERLRRRWRDDVEEMGGRLTPTVFAMKAVVAALQEFPRFNASLDVAAEDIVLKQHYHLGIAVDTGRGLLVPVVRDVDRKSMRDLAVEFTELAERTRNGDATREDLAGGTFTITNPGPIGGTGFSPIVNWPEVAILGMGQARLEAVVEGDLEDHETVTRLRLPLALTFDHRVVDGAEAARFARFVVDRLEDPESLMLDA